MPKITLGNTMAPGQDLCKRRVHMCLVSMLALVRKAEEGCAICQKPIEIRSQQGWLVALALCLRYCVGGMSCLSELREPTFSVHLAVTRAENQSFESFGRGTVEIIGHR